MDADELGVGAVGEVDGVVDVPAVDVAAGVGAVLEPAC
jgi:hypothetical protein